MEIRHIAIKEKRKRDRLLKIVFMLLVTPLSGSEIRSRMIFRMILLNSGSCPLLEAAQCETSSRIFSQVPISFPIRNLLDPSSQMSKK